MKKIVILLLFAMSLFGCERIEEYHRSFISGYRDCSDIELKYFDYDDKNVIRIIEAGITNLCTFKDTGRLKELYDALCVKNNDMTYNRTLKFFPNNPRSTPYLRGFNFVSVDMVSDADFDEDHPADMSLGDVIRLETSSVKPYIDSGYRGQEFSYVESLLSELTPETLILTDGIDLYFEHLPTLAKTHNFTVTMTADDGRVFSDTIEITFE